MTLFRWPDRAAQNRRLSKDQIITRAKMSVVRVGARTRAELTDAVARIAITHLLNPQTTNLPAQGEVEDITVLSITLKNDTIPEVALTLIDKALPRATVFECVRPDGRIKMLCAYKRPSEGDSQRWVSVGGYAVGVWSDPAERLPLPGALSLAGLYRALIQSILPHPAREGETLPEHIARMEAVAAFDKRIATLERKVAREQQPNRRVDANEALKRALQERNNFTDN